jgi:hypothetical protein
VSDLLATGRAACFCAKTRKPCSYHEGMEDGIAIAEDDAEARITELTTELRAAREVIRAHGNGQRDTMVGDAVAAIDKVLGES